MAGLGSLVVSLFADTAQFQAGLTRAQQKAQKAFKDIEHIARVATIAITAASAATAAMAKQAINTADDMSKSAQKIGTTTEFLSALKYAADLSNVSFEKLSVGLGMLAKNAGDIQAGTGEARNAFAALRIEVEKAPGQLKDVDTLLLELADKFAHMKDSTEKTAFSMKIFGESGKDLIPLLNNGADGLKRFMERAKELGVVIDTDTGKAAERLNSTFTEMGALFEGFKLQAGVALLPALQGMANAFLDASKGAKGFKDEFSALGVIIVNQGRGFLVVISALTSVAKDLVAVSIAAWEAAHLNIDEAAATLKLRGQEQVKEMNDLIRRLRILNGEIKPPPLPTGPTGTPPANVNLQTQKAANAALQKLLDQRVKMQADAAQHAAAQEMAILEAEHAANLVSEHDYFMSKLGIQARASESEIAALDKQIALQRDYLSKQKAGTADYYNAQVALEASLAKRNQLESDWAQITKLSYYEADRAAKAYIDSVKDINIQILELEGKTAEATRQRLALQDEQLRRTFAINNDQASLGQLKRLEDLRIAQAQFNEERDNASAITARLAIQEERIQNSQRTGAIDELTAMAQTGAARADAVRQLEAIVQAQEAVAEASKNPALILQAEQARAALENLRSEVDLVAQHITTTFEDAFSSAFADFVTGTKSASEAFKQFANTVVNELARMYAKMIATQIFGGGQQGGGAGGIGGWLAGLFNFGGSTGGEVAAAQAAAGSFFGPGFASGGRPPVGVPSLVGESGPELFVPDVSGTVVPSGEWGAPVYNIDARGADPGQLKRLENMIRQIGGTVNARSVAAVADARRRGVKMG